MTAAREADVDRLLALVGANWTTQAIGAAVRLGIVDRLAKGPLLPAALARDLRIHAGGLARLARALTGLDLVREDAKGRLALTPTGALLRADAGTSVRDWALWCSGEQWRLWADLHASVRTGRSARDREGADPGYAHLARDAESARIFHGAMAGLTRRVARDVAAVLDWRGVSSVVDVGGGHGELLAQVLLAHPALRGTIVDLPHARAGATRLLAEAGLGKRGRFVSGNFFEPLPPGADRYVLKSILHNWDDASCLVILRRCREAMGPESRLLLVERVMPERPRGGRRDLAIVRSDLNMLASLGGKERTRREFAALLAEAGFSRPAVRPTSTDYGVLESKPARAAARKTGRAATGKRP